MADVAVRNPATGELRMVAEQDADAFVEQTGWHVADEAQKARGAKLIESGGVGAQTLAAGETAIRTATLGLVPGLAKGWQQRAEVQQEEHPIIGGAALAAGALAPALLTGGLAGGAAGAVGLGARGTALAVAGAEGLAGGLATEIEEARAQTRDVSAGNIFLYGLGGEIVGRALPGALKMGAGKIKRALTAVEEVAGEGVPSALAGAEARSVQTEARLAKDLPVGPERQAALERTAKEQYDRMAPEVATDLDDLIKTASEMGDTSSSPRVVERLKATLPDDSPAQENWFTGLKERLSQVREAPHAPLQRTRPVTLEEVLGTAKGPKARAALDDELQTEVVRRAKERGVSLGTETGRGAESPVSLAGKSLEDLGALPFDELTDRASTIKGLRESPEFAATGRAPRAFDREGHEVGVKLSIDPDDGSVHLIDGRHRFSIAKEKDLESVWGTIREAGSGKVLYQGDIPLKATARQADNEGLGKIWDEVLGERAPKGKSLAEAGNLTGHARRFDQIIDNGLRRLDKAEGTAEQFLIARDVKQQLQSVSKKMGLDKTISDTALHDEMRGMVDEAWRGIRDGLADESLFGKAGQIERDINGAWSDKILKGLGTTESDLARKVDVDFRTGRTVYEADPSKVRNFLKSDAVDRTITARKLDDVLDGAEEMLAAHRNHGTWDPAQIAKQEQRIARVREARKFADEVQVAQATKAEPKSVVDQVKAYGKSEAIDYAAETVMGALPYGGQIYRLGKRILGIDQAARNATRQTARRLAGTAAAAVETGLGKAQGVAAVPAMTALARFTGDYSGPEESFQAKRQVLDAEQVSPDALYETIGASLEDLPKVNPALFQQISARTAQKVRYLRANLPAGIKTTMMYPNGTPPSQSALREWATIYNTVMDPHSVLEDIDAGTANHLQMKTLRENDPDIYEQLRSDVVEEIGKNFQHVPLSTKLQLDILFDADGLAGPFFSSKAAGMIAQSMKEDAQRGPSGKAVDMPVDELSTSAGPGGISAIQSSVTNHGGGA